MSGDRLRVAMVCPYSLSVPGGVQGQVLGLARALVALGHEPTVIAPSNAPVANALVANAPAANAGLAESTVLRIGRATAVRANGSVAPVALSPLAFARTHRILRSRSFDVVHLHEPFAPGPNYVCLLESRSPLVGTFHRSGASSLYRYMAPLARWAAGRLAVRCAVSEAARDTAVAATGAATRGDYLIVGNGVELEGYGAPPAPSGEPTVLFVGRHEPRKGLAVLLAAWASLDPQPVLWVAGAGPQTDELRRRYPPSPKLLWLGAIDDQEKKRRMATADVLCAPSLGGESFGVVLLEAMAAGCFVVASDLLGYRSVAGGRGRLTPPGDAGALALALEAALDASRSSEAGEERLALVSQAERWSMSSLAARYVEIYRDLVT